MPTTPSTRELFARLQTVGVTGTNGKTTTTSLIAAIAATRGTPAARVTTLGTWIGPERLSESLGRASFDELLRETHRRDLHTLCIEVTSTALAKGFASQYPTKIAVFTNLSRDHLDEHGTPESYLAAKAQLFMTLPPGGAAILNADDPVTELLQEVLPPNVTLRTFSTTPGSGASLTAAVVKRSSKGIEIVLEDSPAAKILSSPLHLPMLDPINASNALAAALAAFALGHSPQEIHQGLSTFKGVPGRFEKVADTPLVIVDFAHTPAALRSTLQAAQGLLSPNTKLHSKLHSKFHRKLHSKLHSKLYCVFGCGGSRDPGKRAEMGRVAEQFAARIYLTTDNPRAEPPEEIAAMVRANIQHPQRWTEEPDRARAITAAILEAAPQDVILIAGKGHEETQIFADHTLPFSDAAVAKDAVLKKHFTDQ